MTSTDQAVDYIGPGLYRVKRLRFPNVMDPQKKKREWAWRPIVLQNENGPCPLIAICNILLLCGDITIHPDFAIVSFDQLTAKIKEHVQSIKPPSAQTSADFDQNRSDAIAQLPRLAEGLDVNVGFSGVDKFEFTAELLLFDLLNINLIHGWLPDPNDAEFDSVSPLFYNRLVEQLVTSPESDASRMSQQFLDRYPSQLSYHGLFKVNNFVNEDDFAVMFRNNHFSTLYKFNGQLFLLCTDQGYFDLPICWEHLSAVEGDSQMCTDLFEEFQPPSEAELQAHALEQVARENNTTVDELLVDNQAIAAAASATSNSASSRPNLASAAAADAPKETVDRLLEQQSAILLTKPELSDAEARDAALAAQLQREEQQAAAQSASQLSGPAANVVPVSSRAADNFTGSADELIARQLQLEERALASQEAEQEMREERQEQGRTAPSAMKLSDEDLARQLQEEFDKESLPPPVAHDSHQRAQETSRSSKKSSSTKKKSGVNAYGDQAAALREANAARLDRQRQNPSSSSSSNRGTSSTSQRPKQTQSRQQQPQPNPKQNQDLKKDSCSIQ